MILVEHEEEAISVYLEVLEDLLLDLLIDLVDLKVDELFALEGVFEVLLVLAKGNENSLYKHFVEFQVHLII